MTCLNEEMESHQWDTIRAYFNTYNINESKIQSYNRFVSQGLPSICKNEMPLIVKEKNMYHIVFLDKVTINKPIIKESNDSSHLTYPKEVRLRGLTYASQVYFHMRYLEIEMPHDRLVPMSEVLGPEGKCVNRKILEYVPAFLFPVLTRSILCNLLNSSGDHGECPYNSAGVFIINGGEKVLMYRERPAYNKIFFSTIKEGAYTHRAEYRSEYYEQFKSTQTLFLEVSKATNREPAALFIQGIPWVTFLRALGKVDDKEIYTLFRFVARKRWNKVYKSIFLNSLRNNQGILTQDAALARIGAISAPAEKDPLALKEAGQHFILNKFLPNIGCTEDDHLRKVYFLLEMATGVIDFVQDNKLKTDKDSYFNKRSESCEDLLGTLTRQFLKGFIQGIKNTMIKKLAENKSIDLYELFASDDKVGKGIADSLASGMWHATKNKITQTGVSQKAENLNFIISMAQHMKVINQLKKEVKKIETRLLHSTSCGTICPTDSPEGATCGLVKHNALLQHQSIGTDGTAIRDLLFNNFKGLGVQSRDAGVVDFSKLTLKNCRDAVLAGADYVIVNINGAPIGVYDNALEVANFVRECRRKTSVSWDTSVSFDHLYVDIRTERGRNMRPLFIGNKLGALNPRNPNRIKIEDMAWTTLISEGIVEYVDKEEEQNLEISPDIDSFYKTNFEGKLKSRSHESKLEENNYEDECIENNQYKKAYNVPDNMSNEFLQGSDIPYYDPLTLEPIFATHMEIHGSMILGLSASLIPFPDHNQSPRNTYQCAMGRASQGIHSLAAQEHRMDTSMMVMWYAQRPIVETQIAKIMHCEKFPSGQNILMAVMTRGESAQEDSTEVCRGSAENAMLRSSVYKTVIVTEKKLGKSENSEEFRNIPDEKLSGRKKGDSSQIEEDGLIGVGGNTTSGTFLAKKVTTQKVGEFDHKCMSVTSLSNENGIVHRVCITSTACGTRTAKIQIVRTNGIEKGDKFSSRHGQKGVCGNAVNMENLPHTADGVIPDFMINTLAFSSRMTWAQWLEALYSTICIMNGVIGDATAFSTQYRQYLFKAWEKHKPNFDKGHIVDEFCDALRRMGLNSEGEKVMYSGTTGKKFQTRIQMTMCYVQKLKHMSKEKIRARGRGRQQALVRQAAEGKTLNGGLKFGEMERDCLNSHGASANIQDRMCFSSDPIYLHVCKLCNNTAIFNEEIGKVYCIHCDKEDTSLVVLLPYSAKLFTQELMAANINVKFNVEEA